jgi:hypothetical protein
MAITGWAAWDWAIAGRKPNSDREVEELSKDQGLPSMEVKDTRRAGMW